MKNIVFFNQFHNGDCFVGKGWVRNIMQQLPDMKFFYIHGNNPAIVKDLQCRQLGVDTTPRPDDTPDTPENANQVELCEEFANKSLTFDARSMRMGIDDDTIYINTWCGAFQGELFGFHQHSNYIIQHQMYDMYCEQLTKLLNRPVTQSGNPHDYLPFIDFSYYDTAMVDRCIADLPFKRLVLFCNGTANSGQSAVGDFKFSIDFLSKQFTDIAFICTHDIGLERSNVFYTSRMFNKASDLNEIAYLSTKTELIIGKNSGPFSYCQFDANMNDSGRRFFCFGKSLTDCLNAGLEFPAEFKFCDQTNDHIITNILVRELTPSDEKRTGMQHITF